MGLLALGAVDHAPLLPPAASDVAGFLCIALSLIVSAGGGIGGGGVLLPVYILVLSFSPRQAVPLASATMLGAALANTLCNARKRHPVADRPAIDWGIVVVLLPTTLAGALLGSTLSVVVPEIGEFLSSNAAATPRTSCRLMWFRFRFPPIRVGNNCGSDYHLSGLGVDGC